MLFSILSGGNPQTILISLLLTLPIIVFALSIHETAHGYAAWKCGDNTAYNLGRLSLNPAKHIDLMGTIAMLVFGFGWAKPVPVNTRNFRNHKRGMAITAAAGPLANILTGIVSILFYSFFAALFAFATTKGWGSFAINCIRWLATFAMLGAEINLVFAFFNLIPIPPFDGSRIAFTFLPTKTYFSIMRYEREIMYGILIALIACSYLFDFSPFSWLAIKTVNLIEPPLTEAFWKLFVRFL